MIKSSRSSWADRPLIASALIRSMSRWTTVQASSDAVYCLRPRELLPHAGVLDNGDLIVYSYPYRKNAAIDEYNIPYVTSADAGRTWSQVQTAHFARAIRNPQLSRKIGDLYFLHGRSGSHSRDPSNLILLRLCRRHPLG